MAGVCVREINIPKPQMNRDFITNDALTQHLIGIDHNSRREEREKHNKKKMVYSESNE